MSPNHRWIELVRGGWGASLLFAPRQVLENIHRVKVDTKSVLIARILGGRQLGQAALSGLSPSPEVLAMGVWVDVAHAATALGLAAGDRSRARAGLVDAAVAGTWALVGYHDLARDRATRPRHDRHRDVLARWVLGVVPGGKPLLRTVHRVRHETP